jgi:imidazolonepropionase-like amidohydrolase
MHGKIGVIARDAYADIIALSENPLDKIKAMENVGFVMKDGSVFKDQISGH